MAYMLKKAEADIAKEWEKYRGYTVRPLPSLVKYYEKIIAAHGANNRFLLFGGTPEIRSIFQQQQKKLILYDKSMCILKAMGRLTYKKMPIAANEIVMQKNWLEKTNDSLHTDLIIGDDAINMLPWQDFEIFIRHAYRMLNENGIFVCHLLVKPDEFLIDKTFFDIFKEFNQGLIKSKYDLASRLNFICFDKKSYAMGWQQTIDNIGKKCLDLFKPAFDFVDTFAFCNSQFYCPPQMQFENIVKNYFSIEEIFYAHEWDYCLFEPVYVLKKRSLCDGIPH